MTTHLLSKRETDIYLLLIEGIQQKKIAEELGITLRTVKFHSTNIYIKLGVRDRTELILHNTRNNKKAVLSENLTESQIYDFAIIQNESTFEVNFESLIAEQ